MSEFDMIMASINEIKEENKKLQGMVIKLTGFIVGSKQWITPEEAAKILNRNKIYLTNNKDKMGLIYSQEKKWGTILFSYASVMAFIESKSGNHSMKWESKIK